MQPPEPTIDLTSDGVDVEPRAVHEESARASGLEDVVSRVKIDSAETQFVEEVVLNYLDGSLGRSHDVVGHKAPELCLDADYPLPRLARHILILRESDGQRIGRR